MDPSVVELYLKFNPSFLDEFVKANVQQMQVAKWLDLKSELADNAVSIANKHSESFLLFPISLVVYLTIFTITHQCIFLLVVRMDILATMF